MSGLVMKGLGLAGIAASSEVWQLAVAVTFLGLGTGFINPSLSGSISLLTKESEQGSVMGINQSLSALGRILGPVLGGLRYRDVSHQSPFWAASLVVGISLLIGISIFQSIPTKARVVV